MRSSLRRGPSTARDWPEAANSARSTNEPASAPTCEPSAAPVSVAPNRDMPAGKAALPTAAPAMARARVAMGGGGQGLGDWG
jgi:hypothetical protein